MANKIYDDLAEALEERNKLWTPDGKTLSFAGVEMAGECGEACNVIKKLERERLGWPGSRATKEQLAQELSDVIITAYNVAALAGIDMSMAVAKTFNDKSVEMGFPVLLAHEGRKGPDLGNLQEGGEGGERRARGDGWRDRQEGRKGREVLP